MALTIPETYNTIARWLEGSKTKEHILFCVNIAYEFLLCRDNAEEEFRRIRSQANDMLTKVGIPDSLTLTNETL